MLIEIKRTLEITDTSLDAQLNDFIKRITDRLLLRLGEPLLPLELQFIVVEATVKRFQFKGNEGMQLLARGRKHSYATFVDEYL